MLCTTTAKRLKQDYEGLHLATWTLRLDLSRVSQPRRSYSQIKVDHALQNTHELNSIPCPIKSNPTGSGSIRADYQPHTRVVPRHIHRSPT